MATNPYYDWATGSRFVKFDTVRAADVNAALDSVTSGFDMLPVPASLWGGKANFAVDSGIADAYVVSVAPTYITSYTDGLLVRMRPLNASTGASTINVNGLGVKSIKLMNGDALGVGNIAAGVPVDLVYSSTTGFFHVVGGLGATGAPGTNGTNGADGSVTIIRSARTGNTILGATDQSTFIDITSGTFTQTFDAAATLGSSWFCYVRNSGTGNVTLDPNGAETIDGLASFIMYPGEVRLVQCDGSALRSVVLQPFTKTFTASGTFTTPPGYSYFGGLLWAGGASGSKYSALGTKAASGGGAGGCYPFTLPAALMGASETVTLGAGGAAQTAANTVGTAGGASSIGTIITISGGGVGTQAYNGGTGSRAGVDFVAGTGGAGASAQTGGAGFYAGGGGGGGESDGSAPGGASTYGGGGGGAAAASFAAAGGASKIGGAGGAGVIAGNGVDGTAPGGAGGATRTGTQSGAGARGELRIWGIA